MFNNKEVEVRGIPKIPEYAERTFYKVTIEKVTKKEVAEVSECFVDLETGEVINSSWKKEDGHKYKHVKFPTGDTETKTQEVKIYEQELESLDIGDLAVYINRTR